MAPKLQNSGLTVLLLAITLILSWWIAKKAHSHLPKANNGIEGKISGLAPLDILIGVSKGKNRVRGRLCAVSNMA